MSRFLSSSQQALSEADTFAFRTLADIGVTSSTLHVCDGYRYLYAMGNTYSPIGQFGGYEPIQEESDPFPRGVRLWMSAANSSQLYEPFREDMFNRPVTLYRAFLNPETLALSNTPEPMFRGQINQIDIRFNDADRGNYYEIEAANDLRRAPAVSYFNKETLWLTYSGDAFCDFMHLIPTMKSMWGQQPTHYVGGSATGHWESAPGGRIGTRQTWVPG